MHRGEMRISMCVRQCAGISVRPEGSACTMRRARDNLKFRKISWRHLVIYGSIPNQNKSDT